MVRNSLLETHPNLAKEWHPTKNGDLTPADVSKGMHMKVWWMLPYDDPETGKHFDFEWEAAIYMRVQGRSCPYLVENAKVWTGFNDLATKCPELAKEWHPTKNGTLTPENVTVHSHKKVWWLLPYDDPRTGKHFDFEWEVSVDTRTGGNGCPFLSENPKVWPGFNDLESLYPAVAAEWHPIKNGTLKPSEITYGSSRKVWWLLSYDDPRTGKHFDFEWEAAVRTRTTKGCGCPYLSGHAVYTGFNDLASQFPDIAVQLDIKKNGGLTADKINATSKKEIWWLLPYDDPKTGKHFDFSWKSTPYKRTVMGFGCPYLTGYAVYRGFNDLASQYPEVAKEWHPTRNGTLKPEDVVAGSPRSVWWLLPYDDPVTGRHFNFEWQAGIQSRTDGGNGCPYLTGHAVWIGFNDLATRYPEIAKEWHPFKNGKLTPTDVTGKSHQVVWWYLPYDDPETGKRFDFEWKVDILSRTKDGNGCPFLAKFGGLVWPGFNDLQTNFPEIAKEWHPIKNGDLTPDKVMKYSTQKVWWYLPYDDPKTGKHFDFEWEDTVANRTFGRIGCPYLSGHLVWVGFNDLATTHPEAAAHWHPTKNGDLTPEMVTYGSNQMVWWLYPYDDPNTGKHFDFEWSSTVAAKVGSKYGCPYLTNDAVWVGFNDLATTHPEVAAQWHPTKNGNLTPEMVTAGSNQLAWWFLSYTDPSTGKVYYFEWVRTVTLKVRSLNDCPYTAGHAVWTGYNDLQSCFPDIAEQWSEKNRFLKPDKIYKFSKMKAWWKCPVCESEWRTSINSRTIRGTGCPKCASLKRKFHYLQ